MCTQYMDECTQHKYHAVRTRDDSCTFKSKQRRGGGGGNNGKRQALLPNEFFFILSSAKLSRRQSDETIADIAVAFNYYSRTEEESLSGIFYSFYIDDDDAQFLSEFLPSQHSKKPCADLSLSLAVPRVFRNKLSCVHTQKKFQPLCTLLIIPAIVMSV